MIRELIVVEGIHDISAVRQAVDAEVVETNGFVLGPDVVMRIRRALGTCGVIVLTDPDPVGEQLRRRIEAHVGPCTHAYVAREDCTREGDIGIENAAPAVIRAALEAVRAGRMEPRTEFTMSDLLRFGLQGTPDARDRRIRLGNALHLGYGNARQLLRRLNHLGVTREEFEAAASVL